MKNKIWHVHHADIYALSVLTSCSQEMLCETFEYLKDKFHSRRSLKVARRLFRQRLKVELTDV
jgi:hypothetical protein